MKIIKGRVGFVHTSRLAPSIKTALVDLWSAYSKPTPEASKELLTLLLLCFVIAVVTGSILFNWMLQVLCYDRPTAATVAGLSAVAAFLLLSLVHPFRCVFTMILATLGTKQGRKLILSTCLMLLALNVIPNIAANVGVVAHVLKCTAGGLARSLINSSELMNRAKGELVKEASRTNLDITSTLRDFDHYTYINVSGVQQRTSEAWLLDIPSTSISISILYKVKSSVPVSCLLLSNCEGLVVDFQRVYPWNFSFGSGHCALEPSEPDRGVAALLGFLFVVAYVMVLLEVYARRMRRKVSSSFFKKQEEKRINFLFKKILEKQDKEKSGIFFIETTHRRDI
ncbi:hypothetical protein MATL_G00104290 [Megalops atlanticus]|uniref:Dendritic cell-specific transmembrane protein-like domain-containing protein n=1 Tax=Megalops atlanticus TaxID=7932 RepID=A0A9D3TC07_MEGAT|nr:hypothetical protein MATL_G00104290 [Megalops atlanticus]